MKRPIGVYPVLIALLWLGSSLHAQTWNLAWSDDFAGPPGTPINGAKWTYDVHNLGVNQELEWYCAPSDGTAPCSTVTPNAYIDGANHLAIQHRLVNGTWTSARLKTQGLKDFTYGRIEASIQIPSHQGLWPAFWMLGSNINTVGWPASGEVDIMENWPAIGPTKNATSMHGPGYSGGNSLSKLFTLPNGERVDDPSFHTYGIIWSPNMMQFYLDDPANITFVQTAFDTPAGAGIWPFNGPFFLITNMAVGGTLGGTPDAGTEGAGTMLVDYVRYYQAATVAGPVMSAPDITVTAGASGDSVIDLSSVAGTGLVYLACTGAPAKSTCNINSGTPLNSYVVDFRSSATAQATVHVTTTAATAQAVPSSRGVFWAAFVGIAGLLVLPLANPQKARRLRACAGIICLFITVTAIQSCGGSSGGGGGGGGGGTPGTPAGHYPLTITAYTVSGDTSTKVITLNVN